jgi:hypothetical protein
MIKYSVAMGIRVLCLLSILFVHGWWMIIPALGAVFLPYFAVIVANAGGDEPDHTVLRPGTIVPAASPSGDAGSGAPRSGGRTESPE